VRVPIAAKIVQGVVDISDAPVGQIVVPAVPPVPVAEPKDPWHSWWVSEWLGERVGAGWMGGRAVVRQLAACRKRNDLVVIS
jgi:hypothetical protein